MYLFPHYDVIIPHLSVLYFNVQWSVSKVSSNGFGRVFFSSFYFLIFSLSPWFIVSISVFFFFSSIAIFRFCWTWSFVPICNFHLIKEDGSSSSSSKKRFIIWKAPVCENYLIPSLFKTPWHTYHIYLFAILCFFVVHEATEEQQQQKSTPKTISSFIYFSSPPKKNFQVTSSYNLNNL